MTNSMPPATPPITYWHRLSPQAQESAVHGPVSVHLARLQSVKTPPTQDISTHKAPTFPASPAAQLSALPTQWRASLDGLDAYCLTPPT